MGVDVNLYAVGPVSDEELATANAFFCERDLKGWDDDGDCTPLLRSKYEADGRIEWNTGDRYYGPGYERGSWPRIYAAIRALQVALPQCAVFYGGDTTDDGMPCTDEYLASIWRHWCGPHHGDYRSRV